MAAQSNLHPQLGPHRPQVGWLGGQLALDFDKRGLELPTGDTLMSINLLKLSLKLGLGEDVGAFGQPGVGGGVERPAGRSRLAGDRRQHAIQVQETCAGSLPLGHPLKTLLHARHVAMDLQHDSRLHDHRRGQRGQRERLVDPFLSSREVAEHQVMGPDQIGDHRIVGKVGSEAGLEGVDLVSRCLAGDDHAVQEAPEARLRWLELDCAP